MRGEDVDACYIGERWGWGWGACEEERKVRCCIQVARVFICISHLYSQSAGNL